MSNIFSNMANSIGDWMAAKIAPYINDAMGRGYSVLGSYYKGDQRPQLKVAVGKQDDNITVNYVGLAVDRSVSRLFRGGVDFTLPEGADEQQEWLDTVWDLNKKEILLYQIGLHGAVYGTPYIKISPDGILDPYTGKAYPRLIAIDPEIIRVKVSHQDMSEVEQYIIEYSYKDDGKEIAHREITRHGEEGDYDEGTEQRKAWIVEEYEQVGSGPWQLVSSVEWPYDFPPIIHWKNLPSLKSCYGDSDIDDAINIQDKSNFVTSNTGKIIKFHAHPEVIGTGFQVKDMTALDTAVGTFRAIANPEAKVFTLEMQSDLASSLNFGLGLRQSIFDVSREVDISSMADKLGALTNFGLQVLWSDALDKNDTKRQLYGDALLELNRRLLVIAGYDGEDCRPGSVGWGDPMPVNVVEEINVDKTALEVGIVDLETLTKRYKKRYGVDFETVQANIAKKKTDENENNDNIGAAILRNFSQNRQEGQ